ncbi:hypothetical protein VTK26DRAFT_885 [Humicola hyalothermophila]
MELSRKESEHASNKDRNLDVVQTRDWLFLIHFWDPGQVASVQVLAVATLGAAYPYRDVSRNAWKDILSVYFTPTSWQGSSCHSVSLRPNRGRPRGSPDSPDLVVTVHRNMQRQPGPRPPGTVERDVIWVYLIPPCEDTPGKWAAVLNLAVTRLAAAHPSRMVYLVLACGLKWLPFVWNPRNPAPRPLEILEQPGPNGVCRSYATDIRIQAIPSAALAGQKHLVTRPDGRTFVRTSDAYSLDFWTTNRYNGMLNEPDMVLLEDYLYMSKNGESVVEVPVNDRNSNTGVGAGIDRNLVRLSA